MLIGHVAGGTETIRVGSGGVMLPNHAPLIVAEHYGTLATLYPGRIDLGVGRAPGSDRATAHAMRRSLDREEDFPQQVRELLGYLGPEQPGQTVRAVPGQGTNVPVWLLGSSTYSAQLAAAMGLPFAFAAHFAPQDMVEALLLYRRYFQPSQYLSEPYSAVGVPLVAADTDEEARRLATSPYQRFLRLIRGQRLTDAASRGQHGGAVDAGGARSGGDAAGCGGCRRAGNCGGEDRGVAAGGRSGRGDLRERPIPACGPLAVV